MKNPFVALPVGDPRDVNRMRKPELQALCQELGLSTEGKVSDLKLRIAKQQKDDKSDTQKSAGDQQSASGSEAGGKSGEHYASSSKKVMEEKDGEQSAGNYKRKKKKWLITDPAEIPPHHYNQDVFRANFPLVDIVEVEKGSRFPVRDKFEGPVLDEKETRMVRRMWIRRLYTAGKTYTVPQNETQAFAHQFAPLKYVTRPSKVDVETQNEHDRKRKWRYEDVKDIGRPKLRKLDAEEHRGMCIVPGTEQVADYSVGAEEAAGDLMEDEDVSTGYADGVLHIHDDAVAPDGNTDRVAAVLERKFADDKFKENARYQGGFYAVKHCLNNLQKGHGAAVYELILSLLTWSYGILVPEGYVQFRNGVVDEESMHRFREHQRLTGERTLDLPQLQEKLSRGTLFYRRCFKDNPKAVYRDGPMLVGKLYIQSAWYNLPRKGKGAGEDAGAARFFDGLLRLVLGDSAMDMSQEDFVARERPETENLLCLL